MDECRRTPAGGRADDVHAVPGDHADLRGLRRPDAPRGGGLRHVRRGLYDAAKQANISGTIVHKATIDKNAEKTSTRFAKSWGGGILKGIIYLIWIIWSRHERSATAPPRRGGREKRGQKRRW